MSLRLITLAFVLLYLALAAIDKDLMKNGVPVNQLLIRVMLIPSLRKYGRDISIPPPPLANYTMSSSNHLTKIKIHHLPCG